MIIMAVDSKVSDGAKPVGSVCLFSANPNT